jgi:hypothetical protein
MIIPAIDDKSLAESLGIYDRTISDKVVADRILQNIKGIYSWIALQTIDYQFQGTPTPRETREITVRPSNWESLYHLLSLLYYKPDSCVSIGRASSAILGSKDLKDITHLQTAANKNLKIVIRISMDREHINAEPAEISQWRICMVMYTSRE